MWKDYSIGSLKHNRASGISIMAGALICSLFLSLLCTLAYNFWLYDIEKIIREEGAWQARITAALQEEELAFLNGYGNIRTVAPAENGSAYDIYFYRADRAYQDMAAVRNHLELEADEAFCHDYLLSRYLIHDPADPTPPMLLSFLLILLLVCALALVLILHNSFAVSMYARIHQFGILSSIGATPGQLRACLLQEAAALCILPVLTGTGLGAGLGAAALAATNRLLEDVQNRFDAVFHYHPLLFVLTLSVCVLTVLVSAWIPARKLARMTPLEAIRYSGDPQARSRRRHALLLRLFGAEWELAAASLYARRKALRTTTLSLLLSFLAFTVFSCFAAFSQLSVYETSFSKYQDYWDIYAELPGTDIGSIEFLPQVRALENVEDAALYQKAESFVLLPGALISDELKALGGWSALAGADAASGADAAVGADAVSGADATVGADAVSGADFPTAAPSPQNTLRIKAPLLILDDASFLSYCRQIGAEERMDGAIVLNRIWDSLHSSFRSRRYIPFLQPEPLPSHSTLCGRKGNILSQLPLLCYTDTPPVLWEEYENYSLVHILPLSLWKQLPAGCAETVEDDTLLRIFTYDDTQLNEDMKLIQRAAGNRHCLSIHNRVQDLADNDRMWAGISFFMSFGCGLLALIGIAAMFTHTLGFFCQRKREFAQLMSIGVTPAGMRKLLAIEAALVAGKPVLITLPLTALIMLFMIRASHMEVKACLPVMPFGGIACFILAIFSSVGLAYYLGARKLFRSDLSEVLRDDTV